MTTLTVEQLAARLLARCGSTHETRFACGVLEHVTLRDITGDGAWEFCADDVNCGRVCTLVPQKVCSLPMGRVRLDFVFGLSDGGLVVEIDDPGHWRDPVKAVADRRRDRQLLALGFRVLRFSNEDITANAPGAGKEALSILGLLLDAEDARDQHTFSTGWSCGLRRAREPVANALQTMGLWQAMREA